MAEPQLYKPVTDRLAEMTGKKIQFFMRTSYASVVERMLSGFVHLGVLGPYTYVIANAKDPNIEVFATRSGGFFAALSRRLQGAAHGHELARPLRLQRLDRFRGVGVDS